jgi:DNA-binding transcriptional LysR family regulator
MELRHLRYFLAVAETLNFGRAAARLGIAQPPLSVQIRDLEQEIGAPLFHRGPRGVTLTDAGAALLPRALAVLEASQQAFNAARDAAAGRGGRLVIGFIPSLAYSVLPRLLPAWRRAHPGVAVALREVAVTDKEEALLSGSIDVGIYRPPARHPEIAVFPFAQERMIAALPVSHRLARRRRLRPADLLGESLVLYPPSRGDAGLHGAIAVFLRTHSIPMQAAEIAGTIHTALGLVLSGAGLTIVPESASLLRLEGIAFRAFDEPSARVQLALCTRHGAATGLATSFIEHALQLPAHELAGARLLPRDAAVA